MMELKGPKSSKAYQQRNNEVSLNRAILLKGISKVNCDKRDPAEVDKQFSRVTHLHLQNKGIDILEHDSFNAFKNLTVLYLYDNGIRSIDGLENARNLEALYLQRNRLDRIDGLYGCKKLRQLYLGQNEISVVEGLQDLHRLEELQIEDQRLHPGEELIFDPLTLDTLAASLKILNIRNNKMTSIEDLSRLSQLHTLDAQNNSMIDLDRTSIVVSTMPNLKVVDFRGNPMTRSTKYQEKMIGHCPSVELLDGKSFSDFSRRFITNLCKMKASHVRQSLSMERNINPPEAPNGPPSYSVVGTAGSHSQEF